MGAEEMTPAVRRDGGQDDRATGVQSGLYHYTPNLDEAHAFLKCLRGSPRFGFRTFDDDEERKRAGQQRKELVITRYGHPDDLADELARLNAEGAGAYVTINELDGKGYKAENVTRVRAVFVDLDLPARESVHALQAALRSALPPSIVVQSSMVKFHIYWVLSDDLPLDRFADVQKALINRFNGDKSVHDLPRVMRLPGYHHNKGEPFLSHIVHLSDRRYTTAEIIAEFLPNSTTSAPESETVSPAAEFDAAMLEDALKSIPADDRETYITVIRAVKRSAEEAGFPETSAKEVVRAWAKTSDKYDEGEFETRWAKDFKRQGGKVQRLGSVFKLAADYGWRRPGKLSVEDFYAYMPMHNYIYVPTRDFWPASSVNARVPLVKTPAGPVPPAAWIDGNRAVEQLTWYPGEPQLIEGRIIAEGGWIEQPSAKVFNMYREPPPIRGGSSEAAGPWRDHLARLYPEEHEHILRWLAHRVQRPGQKINHGLILGGAPGIGKDTLLAPVKRAVGYWNMREVSPVVLVESFNDWVKSVILRVSEARDLGGNDMSATNRYALYEHMKVLTTAPPEVLRVNEKHLRQYAVPNVMGVIVTTNYQDGMYLPADDRRFFCAWSELTKGDFAEDYWRDLYKWFDDGGAEHVAAFLHSVNLAGFDPGAPPPWTTAKTAMVDAGRDESMSPIGEALDRMREQAQGTDAVTTADLIEHGSEELRELLTGPKNARRVPHLMAEWGYVKVVNEGARDGRFVVDGKRQAVYAKRELPLQERVKAARALEATCTTQVPF